MGNRMEIMTPIQSDTTLELMEKISERLNSAVKGHLLQTYAPDYTKIMRRFPATEAAELLGCTSRFMRKCHLDGTLPEPEVSGRHRQYSASELWSYRKILDAKARSSGHYLPWRKDGEALQVWQLMNFKGGCSKTTATVHLAHYLALHGFRVLMIDLDPQGSLSEMCGVDPQSAYEGETIYNALTQDEDEKKPMSEVVKDTFLPGLSIAPGDLSLNVFKMEARNDPKFLTRLQSAISQVENDFDVVLIDSPPELDILTLTGMAAATSVICPLTPSMMDVISTSKFVHMATQYLQELSQVGVTIEYEYFKILMTRDEPSDGTAQQLVGFMRTLFAERVLTATSLKSSAISLAITENRSIYELKREDANRDTLQRARASMDAVGLEVRGLIETAWGRV